MSQLVDSLAGNAGFIFILLAVMWGAQFGLAYFQLRRFNRRILEVRKWGKTAVGLSGDRYRGRTYAVLTIDESGKVINAEHFAGKTIFARLQSAPQLTGMTIDEILADPDSLPFSKKSQQAFTSAANYLQEAIQASEEAQPRPA